MANVDVGTGRVRIDFPLNTHSALMMEVFELVASRPLFAEGAEDGVDTSISTAEVGNKRSLVFSAEGGWDSEEWWSFLESLTSCSSPFDDDVKAALLSANINGCSYDWDSNCRSLLIKQKGMADFSVLEHYGVALSWLEILRSLGCFDLDINSKVGNDSMMAEVSLVDKSGDNGSSIYLFHVSAQASSGALLVNLKNTELLLAEEMCDELDSIETMLSQIETGEVETEGIDDWAYSNEVKDDLLSSQNMYKLTRGVDVADAIIMQALETKYFLS